MRQDITALRRFYGADLGRLARRQISAALATLWPAAKGQSVLGVGYPTPYLSLYRHEAARAVAVMPGSQGGCRWPEQGACLATLADDAALPFADRMFDRVLLVHDLEFTDSVTARLREVWRVLAEGGRMAVVAPNRTGLWARLERSPFAYGRPFSEGQLSRALSESLFMPGRCVRTLVVPPLRLPGLGLAATLDRPLGRWLPGVAGVLVLEAEKQTEAVIPAGHAVPKLVPALSRNTAFSANRLASRPDGSKCRS